MWSISYIFSFIFILLNHEKVFSQASSFDPNAYTRRSAVCPAINRSKGGKVVDIRLDYVDINESAAQTIVMVHGWPSLWSTWSKQIQRFENDYHLIAPDLRGFGNSTHPGDVKSSGTMGDLVGDLVCVLEDAKVHSAICMGHDWGSQVCYEAARMRPDIFSAVVGIVVPYIPLAGPFVPVKAYTSTLPKLTYQIFFDEYTENAISELNRDIQRTIRGTMRTVESPPPISFLESSTSFMEAWEHVVEIPPVPFFSENEEDYFIRLFSEQGFNYTLQFYTQENRYQSWAFAHEQGNFTIPQPALAIYSIEDPVADWILAAKLLQSSKFLPSLTTELVNGAHWVHLENPDKVNSAIESWLQDLQDKERHVQQRDEL